MKRRMSSARDFKSTGMISEILHNRAGSIEADSKIIEIFDKLISEQEDINNLLNLTNL